MINRVLIVWMLASMAFAQQLVIPDELETRAQRDLFVKISESISAPCCQNGLPVAYHESGMALHLRDLVKEAILAGKSEKQIMAEMAELRLGPDQDMEVIFTVPDNNPLGWLAWFSPLALILAGIGMVFFFLKRRKEAGVDDRHALSDDEILDRYKDRIQSNIDKDREATTS